ncbi:MAG: hypothetical protein IKL03_05585 [Bacteroidaceae bacterium]|nr:hypothetical protein [Bacteroidaceae bacterium]
MINYVNNSFDKVLKPCDAQQFMTLTQSEQTEKLILGHRAGEKNSKAKLPALTYMGVLDEAKYKDYLKKCEADGTKPLGSRRAEFMRPTGLLMLDFDHVAPLSSPQGGKTPTDAIDSPVKLWEYIVGSYDNVDLPLAEWVALAHITPSGDGLRVVVKRTKGTTIEQEQYEWCKAMKLDAIGIKPDAACKDISRLSFAPMHSEVLYYNPSLLFAELPEAADYPDGSIFQQSFAVASPTEAAAPIAQGEAPAEYDTEYRGVPYSEIVKRLEEQLGGRPEHGARNSFIFSMACNLRYVCNDDAQWIASILPTYGEDPQKHRTTIQSAVNRPMSREMPETLKRALRIAQSELSIVNCQLSIAAPPAMPTALPEPIALLTSRTPEAMKPAVAMGVFPPLGAHLHDVKFRYWDGRDYEATFMNVLVAELSSGKSAVNTPIEYIIADMEARDEVAREKINAWKDACNRIASTQEKPERPKGLAIQVLDPDMTNAAFVQALADAEGRFLYTQMDEVELLNALKTNTQGNTVSAILRLAFDCGKYGQVRVAANAVNAKVRVRWNWNASTTIQRVRKFFAKNIADGTLSRLSFATIVKDDDDWGDIQRPTFGEYGQAFADALQPYIDSLCTTSGTIVCPEAIKWADALSLELIGYAREIDDRTYAQLSFRAVLMGFFRAVLLYVVNGCRWSSEIAAFAEWTVRYDLWCKFRFFRDMLHKDLSGEKTALQRGPVSLLALLPDEFTKQQVQELRIAEGMKPDPRKMLDAWKRRGQIVKDKTREVYVKCLQSTVYS